MDFILKDFSFGLFAWQLVLLLNIPLVIWAIFCLIKSKKQNTSIKLLVLISLVAFPIVSSLIYLSDYYSKNIKDRML
ncbi:hypothetical protein [Flavobacterium sp. I3-2]|uniref:hypothetical protein n=1 Tax=Flavobacterium sp. I3-2 TaxID=2748319 RepID=UPI0015ADDBEA|nr:hypothetical protein [Flavobacterium sp. I3-2]